MFMSDPRYPIGKFSYTGPLTAAQKQQCLTDIEQTPARLRTALRGLSDRQLDTPYRDGGWTPRQVAHHVADSHMNSYIRFKLALTEGQECPDRSVAGLTRFPASSLDADASRVHRRGMEPYISPF